MAKSSRKLPSKRKTPSARKVNRSRLPRRTTSPAQPAREPEQRSGASKQDRIITLLSTSGATIPTIMQRTGWQQHSVRGFLAGVVRRKLKLDLVSEVIGGQRTYRIKGADPSKKPERTLA
jgi:hypothetical protein